MKNLQSVHFMTHNILIMKTKLFWTEASCTFLRRLVCKIQEKSTASQNLSIALQVNEGEVVEFYSIEGTAQVSGFSFVVRTSLPGQWKNLFVFKA